MFKIKIYPEALLDIEQAADWYNKQLPGLGKRFKKQIVKQINKLATTAELHTIRYNEVRCMVINKFPFMVHFTLNNQIQEVRVFAVFHTSRSPQIWLERKI